MLERSRVLDTQNGMAATFFSRLSQSQSSFFNPAPLIKYCFQGELIKAPKPSLAQT
jgi:hypothetical protein